MKRKFKQRLSPIPQNEQNFSPQIIEQLRKSRWESRTWLGTCMVNV